MTFEIRKVKNAGDLIFNSICQLPVTITHDEERFFNSLSLKEIVPVLKDLTNEPKYGVRISSRAFDALMKLKQLDQVDYLIEIYESSPEFWKWRVAERLADFEEPKSIEMLNKIALTDDDADARYYAVYSLYKIGNDKSVSALKEIKLNDEGVDYEGNKIADLAEKALLKILNLKDEK